MNKMVNIKQKNLKITAPDRRKMLFYTNVLKELRNDTSDKAPIQYQTICELEGLLYKMADVFDFKQPDCEHGHCDYWSDFEFKEDLEEKDTKQ